MLIFPGSNKLFIIVLISLAIGTFCQTVTPTIEPTTSTSPTKAPLSWLPTIYRTRHPSKLPSAKPTEGVNDEEVESYDHTTQDTCQRCIFAATYVHNEQDHTDTIKGKGTSTAHEQKQDSVKVNNKKKSTTSTTSSSTTNTKTNTKHKGKNSRRRDLLDDVSSFTSMKTLNLFGYHNSWFESDSHSTVYEITDIDDTIQYYVGQLCPVYTGGSDCDIELPPGQYMWHVTGVDDPHRTRVAWEFCSMYGGAEESMIFTILDNGACVPSKHNPTREPTATVTMIPSTANQTITPEPTMEPTSTPTTIAPTVLIPRVNEDNSNENGNDIGVKQEDYQNNNDPYTNTYTDMMYNSVPIPTSRPKDLSHITTDALNTNTNTNGNEAVKSHGNKAVAGRKKYQRNHQDSYSSSTTTSSDMSPSSRRLNGGEQSHAADNMLSSIMDDLYGMYLYGYRNTWYDRNSHSTIYEITDEEDSIQFYVGQLCHGGYGGEHCSINLPVGRYKWRVFGAENPHRDRIQWEYCGRHGGAESSMYFQVLETGACVARGHINVTHATPTTMPTTTTTSIVNNAVSQSQSQQGSDEINEQLRDSSLLALTNVPSGMPTAVPSGVPSDVPSGFPTGVPTSFFSATPTTSAEPTMSITSSLSSLIGINNTAIIDDYRNMTGCRSCLFATVFKHRQGYGGKAVRAVKGSIESSPRVKRANERSLPSKSRVDQQNLRKKRSSSSGSSSNNKVNTNTNANANVNKGGGVGGGKQHRQLFSTTESMYLYGHHGNWYDAGSESTLYEISNEEDTTLYYQGQLCGTSPSESGESCPIDLPAGKYIFRVTGADDDPYKDQVAWEYCGGHGGAQSSLSFTIDENGVCIPEHWNDENPKNFTENALSILESTLALQGMVTISSEVLLDNGVYIISYEKKSSSTGGTSTGVVVISTLIDFQIDLSLEDGADPQTAINDIVSYITSQLRQSMSDGSFVSNVAMKANSENEICLQGLVSAEFISLSADSSSFEEQSEDGSLGTTVDEDTMLIFDLMMFSAIAVVVMFLYVQWKNFATPKVLSQKEIEDAFGPYVGNKMLPDHIEMEASNWLAEGGKTQPNRVAVEASSSTSTPSGININSSNWLTYGKKSLSFLPNGVDKKTIHQSVELSRECPKIDYL
eukprot:gene2432-4722_t